MIELDYFIRFITSLAPGSCQVSSTRYDFPPVQWAINLIRQLLVTIICEFHLLHISRYLAMLEIVLIHMCQQLTITFNCLPALVVSIVFSGTIEVGLQEVFPGYIQHKSTEYVLSEIFQKKGPNSEALKVNQVLHHYYALLWKTLGSP